MQKAKIVQEVKPKTVLTYPESAQLADERLTVEIEDKKYCKNVDVKVEGRTPARVSVSDVSTAVYVAGKCIYVSHIDGEVTVEDWPSSP